MDYIICKSFSNIRLTFQLCNLKYWGDTRKIKRIYGSAEKTVLLSVPNQFEPSLHFYMKWKKQF